MTTDPAPRRPAWHDGPFMRAARREPVDRVPIWLMRQAGRYMPEYRAIRRRVGFLELCRSPDLCAEVMLAAVERLGVDAAILFADLLPILQPMGLDLEFTAGEGPVLHNPIRGPGDVDRLRELENVEPLDYVFEAVRKTRAGLAEDLPLVGFAGAPFTLASYAIEGGREPQLHPREIADVGDPGAWDALLARLARAVAHISMPRSTPASRRCSFSTVGSAVWARTTIAASCCRTRRAVIGQLRPGVPVIHFATGNPALLPLLREAGGDVIGVDWRIRLDDAWRAIGHDRAIQGNLDPAVLLSNPAEIRRRATRFSTRPPGVRVTSSTSATACFRRRRWRTSSRWSRRSTTGSHEMGTRKWY